MKFFGIFLSFVLLLCLGTCRAENILFPQTFLSQPLIVSKLFILKVVVTTDIHDKNSATERVSRSVQMLLPVKTNT
jgi:hypothetical protein